MPYKRSHRNIHRSVVARAQRFMQTQPWLMTDAERCRNVQTFIEKCLASYGLHCTVQVRTTYYAPGPLGFEAERDDETENALGSTETTWLLVLGPKHSTPVVFTALRWIMLVEGGEDALTEGTAVQASAWGNALLFTVAPHTFRKLARRGRLVGVRPIDTFSQADAVLLQDYGHVREDGHLINYTPERMAALRCEVQGPMDEEASEEVVDEEDVASEPLPEAPESQQEVTDDLDRMNRDEVRQEARNVGVRNVSSHTRGALVTLIREARRQTTILRVV